MLITDDRLSFYNACLECATRHGSSSDVHVLSYVGEGTQYADQLIYIAFSADKKWVEIERKNNNNVIVFVEDGITIRFDYEYIYLCDHINTLLEKDATHA